MRAAPFDGPPPTVTIVEVESFGDTFNFQWDTDITVSVDDPTDCAGLQFQDFTDPTVWHSPVLVSSGGPTNIETTYGVSCSNNWRVITTPPGISPGIIVPQSGTAV